MNGKMAIQRVSESIAQLAHPRKRTNGVASIGLIAYLRVKLLKQTVQVNGFVLVCERRCRLRCSARPKLAPQAVQANCEPVESRFIGQKHDQIGEMKGDVLPLSMRV